MTEAVKKKSMKGVILEGNKVCRVIETPIPEPADDEVLIRVKSAGICGSDLHFYQDDPEALGDRRAVVIGHEPAGVVEETGKAVRHVSPGDRVTVNHTIGCGHCRYCAAGETVLCPDMKGMAQAGHGGDAEYLTMPERNCFHLPPELSYTDGSFIACTGATAFSVVSKMGASGLHNLAVFGLGPVGLSAVLLAKAAGVRVVGIDVLPDRLSFAASAAGIETLDALQGDTVEELRRLSGGGGFHFSLDTSGTAEAQEAAVGCLRPQGSAFFVGLNKGGFSIRSESIIHREIRVIGSKVLSAPLVFDMITFMKENNFSFDPIVSARFPLERAVEAFAEFDKGKAGKYILEP
jgi:propanol-preferring alcohol dehydrogenase